MRSTILMLQPSWQRVPALGSANLFIRCALALTVLLAALSAGACSGNSGATNDTLVFGRNKDALNLDPALATDGLSLNVDHVIVEGLTRYKPGSFAVEPCLATSWSHSGDGTTWTFRLRRNVRFQDGSAFDAAAVKFNLDRWRLRGHPYHQWGAFVYYASVFGGFPGAIRDVAVKDPLTVTIVLAHPLAPLLAELAMPAFAISSPAAIAKYRSDYFRHPTGTGPYALLEWVKDDHITLQRYDGYWGDKAHIARVVIRDFPDAGVARLALQHGDIDGWEYPQADDVKLLQRDPNLRVHYRPANSLMYLALNTQHAPLNKVLVRQAIAQAIDRQTITREFFDPSATVATSMLPPAVWPDDPAPGYRFDPARARQLLALAGFPHGFQTRLWYMTAPRPYLPQPERVAEAIQSELRGVGIDAQLQGLEWGIFLQRTLDGEHDLTVAGWTGDNGDPDNFLYPTLDLDNAHPPNAYNFALWKNEDYHALMLAGQRAADKGERARIYLRALAIVRRETPVVPIAYTTGPIVFNKRVAGFEPAPDGAELFQYLYFHS
ncbi:MAG TPA: ABC transporter substrate-binding protein [Candidatus Eremiobacteraceae bacterium]|nr:ABC transporter substrate-binding protein [Candidatus Eremiobacteraceae bacterium]